MNGEYGEWTSPAGTPWVVNPPPGAIFVLRAGADWTQEQSRQAAEQLSKYAAVIVLAPETDLTVLPEEAMRKLGWCRVVDVANG